MWIQTFTDQKFDLLDPQVDQVDIRVIAHALARICRFGGHTRQFYSVAQHSVVVSYHVPPPYALHGLLHDAAEAYIGDVVRPLKLVLNQISGNKYRAFEAKIEAAICKRLGIVWTADAEAAVREADELALATEASFLLGKPVDNWTSKFPAPLDAHAAAATPETAELGFLARFIELTGPVAHADPVPVPKRADLAGAVVEAPAAVVPRVTQQEVRQALAAATAPELPPTDDGRPLSRLAHEIRLELFAAGMTREQNVTIRKRICEIYAAGELNSAEASYLQEVVALNHKRLDRLAALDRAECASKPEVNA